MTQRGPEAETGDSVRCLACLLPFGGGYVCAHCGVAPKNVPWNYPCLRPGTQLHSRYVIGRSLGQGGFAITYLALQEGLNRRVAIKEYYPSDLADRDKDASTVQLRQLPTSADEAAVYYRRGLERFLEEGQNIVQCHQPSPHPNLVRVTDYFEENGTAYLVMDYVEGISLEDYLKTQLSGRLEERQALELFMPVLNGLSAVHRHGFMHRDVKPGNVYISKEGTVILLDFGSARQSLSKERKTLTVMLTPGYAPPEQYSGDGEQGPWTDVYGSAATLYRCITGETPPSAMARMSGTELLPPSAFPEIRVNGRMEKALMAGLLLDRSERIQSAEALMQALKGNRADIIFEAVALMSQLSNPRRLAKLVLSAVLIGVFLSVMVLLGLMLWGKLSEKMGHERQLARQHLETEQAENLYSAGVKLVETVASRPEGSDIKNLAKGAGIEAAAARDCLDAAWVEAHGGKTYQQALAQYDEGEKSFASAGYDVAAARYREAATSFARLILSDEGAASKAETALAAIRKTVEAERDEAAGLDLTPSLQSDFDRGAKLLAQAQNESDAAKQVGCYRKAWVVYNNMLQQAASRHTISARDSLEKMAADAEQSKNDNEVAMARKIQPDASMVDPAIPVQEIDLGGGAMLQLVKVAAGEFMMGSPDNEPQRQDDEGPQRTVRLSSDFWIGRFEVTVAQFRRFVQQTGYRTTAEYAGGAWFVSESGKREWRKELDWRKSSFSRFPDLPVVLVSWDDAKAFCDWLSGLSGRNFRLPTEAEWEYACRAGASTAFPWGNEERDGEGWLNGADVTLQSKHPEWIAFPFNDGHLYAAKVGSFRGNSLGLHDMLGNVWEWCEDWYRADYYAVGPQVDPCNTQMDKSRTIRGGSWLCYPGFCRSAVRFKYAADCPSTDLGFRVVTLP